MIQVSLLLVTESKCSSLARAELGVQEDPTGNINQRTVEKLSTNTVDNGVSNSIPEVPQTNVSVMGPTCTDIPKTEMHN